MQPRLTTSTTPRAPRRRHGRPWLAPCLAVVAGLVLSASPPAAAEDTLGTRWSAVEDSAQSPGVMPRQTDRKPPTSPQSRALPGDGLPGDRGLPWDKGQIQVTVFDNEGEFLAAAEGPITRESFEEGNVAAGEVLVCLDPYDAATDDACWDPGDIAPRLQVSSSSGSGVALLGPGVAGNESIVTGADTFTDNTQLSFTEGGIFALAVDLRSNQEETIELRLIDGKGVIVATEQLDVTTEPTFWGVVTQDPFSRLEVVSLNGELVDNVRFGPPPPRLEADIGFIDRCLDPVGNVNGIAEPGEGLQLQVSLTAVGGDFHNIVAVFTSPDDDVVSPLPSVGFGDLGNGEQRTRPILLELSPALSCFSSVPLEIEVLSLEDDFRFDRLQDIGRLPIAQDLPLDLRDDDASGVESLLQVNEQGIIEALDVRVQIEHPWVGDLQLQLTSPAGTTVRLLDRPGVPANTFGCSRNDMDVLFSDAATQELEDLCAGNPWFVGTGLPTEPLAAFIGESLTGTWRLRVIDQAPGDGGQLIQWQLISDPPLAGECAPCADSGVLVTPLDIPTMGTWGIASMVALLLCGAGLRLRRRRQT